MVSKSAALSPNKGMLVCALEWEEYSVLLACHSVLFQGKEDRDPHSLVPACSSIPWAGTNAIVWIFLSRVWDSARFECLEHSSSKNGLLLLSSRNLYLVIQQFPEGLLRPLQLILQTQTLVLKGTLQMTYVDNDSCVGRELRGLFSPTEPLAGRPSASAWMSPVMGSVALPVLSSSLSGSSVKKVFFTHALYFLPIPYIWSAVQQSS